MATPMERGNFGEMDHQERRQAIRDGRVAPEDRTPEMQAIVDAWTAEITERTNLTG